MLSIVKTKMNSMEEEEIHRRSPFNFHKCNSCALRTKSLRVILSHVNKHQEESKLVHFSCQSANLEAFECQYCYFETDLKIAVDRHESLVHGGHRPNTKIESKNYVCDKCVFKSYSLLVFVRHICNGFKEKLSVVEEWFNCEHCSYKGKLKKNLKQHVLRKHFDPDKVEWFYCTQCAYKTTRTDHLKKHVIHIHMKWFKCEHCYYTTRSKNMLRQHVSQTHFDPTKVKWLRCTQCFYKTTRTDHLKKHISGKHTSDEKKQFECEHCSHIRKSRSMLWRHVSRTHVDPDEVNWFQCTQCVYKTRRKYALQKHILKKHEETKKFDESVYKHNICYFKEKPPVVEERFKCQHCPYQAKLKKTLGQHVLRTHVDPNEVVWHHCKHCPFKTKRKCSLKTHIYRRHILDKYYEALNYYM